MRTLPHLVRSRAFVLLEVMLAVMIFAIGVIALGRCVENCLAADHLKDDDVRARQALGNAMALIEGGAVVLSDSSTDDLKGIFDGMKLKTTRKPVQEKNEKGQDIFGVFLVTLDVSWKAGGEVQSRQLEFYHYPRQR